MDTVELRKKSPENLKTQLISLLKAQFELRMKSADSVGKPHEFKKLRRTIARLKTVLSEKARVSS
jgi:large subunit ribosomal protein L29